MFAAVSKSFLLLFFKKEGLFLPKLTHDRHVPLVVKDRRV
jgi:hypothetical protein